MKRSLIPLLFLAHLSLSGQDQISLNGTFSFNGGSIQEKNIPVQLEANRSTKIAVISKADWEDEGYQKSAAYARLSGGSRQLAQHRLFLSRYGQQEKSCRRSKYSVMNYYIICINRN